MGSLCVTTTNYYYYVNSYTPKSQPVVPPCKIRPDIRPVRILKTVHKNDHFVLKSIFNLWYVHFLQTETERHFADQRINEPTRRSIIVQVPFMLKNSIQASERTISRPQLSYCTISEVEMIVKIVESIKQKNYFLRSVCLLAI